MAALTPIATLLRRGHSPSATGRRTPGIFPTQVDVLIAGISSEGMAALSVLSDAAVV